MTSSESMIGRAFTYGRRHGFRAVITRTSVAIKRWVTGTRMILFACDLRAVPVPENKPQDIVIERKNAPEQLNSDDAGQIINAWNADITKKLHAERFGRGASLWLLKMEGCVAAYGWTIHRQTIKPHYFPLGAGDVHLFDFFVFPEYRGRRLNPLLVNHILARLMIEKADRALIEAAEWNTPQLASLRQTPFRRVGYARKPRLFGKTTVVWNEESGTAK